MVKKQVQKKSARKRVPTSFTLENESTTSYLDRKARAGRITRRWAKDHDAEHDIDQLLEMLDLVTS